MALIRLNNQSISSVTALPSGVGGKVLQVQQGHKSSSTAIGAFSAGTFADTGLSVNITPTSASNKILIQGSIDAMSSDNCYAFKLQVSTNGGASYTDVGVGDAEGSHMRAYGGASNAQFINGTYSTHYFGASPFTYLHSISSTNQHHYKVVVANEQGNAIVYINRPENWSDENKAHGRINVSTIVATEITN